MSNAFRALLTFALNIHNRELQRAGGVDGGTWGADALNWREDFAPRERELNDLFAAALGQAGRTGFPITEVERRLRNLQTHTVAIMLWPRDAPPLSDDARRELEASGGWSGGPVSDYLRKHTRRMMDAWREVGSLALCIEREPSSGDTSSQPDEGKTTTPSTPNGGPPLRPGPSALHGGSGRPDGAHAMPNTDAAPPPNDRRGGARSAAPRPQDMRVLAFMVNWENALQTGAGTHGQPEHYQLPEPEQGKTPNDRAALKLLRACCSDYFAAEGTILAFLNATPEMKLPIVNSMRAIVAGAREATARAALFDGSPPAGEDSPTSLETEAVAKVTAPSSDPPLGSGVCEGTRDAIPPSPPDPFADVRAFAAAEMKGKQRAVVELLCDRGGKVDLADLAAAVEWEAPYDDTWNATKKAINAKLRKKRLPFRLSRRDNKARLDPIPIGQK
jgi:hypothetical protein